MLDSYSWRDSLASSLDEGMSRLMVDERTALLLIYYEGLSMSDAAFAMDIPVSFFGMILSNAVTKMRSFTDVFDHINKRYGSPYGEVCHVVYANA